MAVGCSSVCVMTTTLAAKEPPTWFNSGVTSWANSGARDLHLDLRQAIVPGARGARELLITALRDAVRSGRLASGTTLPPSRTLASDLGLARNTVSEAYAELVAEGWLASRQGAGTWVVDVRRGPRPVERSGWLVDWEDDIAFLTDDPRATAEEASELVWPLSTWPLDAA